MNANKAAINLQMIKEQKLNIMHDRNMEQINVNLMQNNALNSIQFNSFFT